MGEMPVGILSPLASKIVKACFLAGYVLAFKLHVRRKAGLNLPARKKPRPPEPKPLIETRSSNFNESRLSKSYKVRACTRLYSGCLLFLPPVKPGKQKTPHTCPYQPYGGYCVRCAHEVLNSADRVFWFVYREELSHTIAQDQVLQLT
jgi:hypothetical protein